MTTFDYEKINDAMRIWDKSNFNVKIEGANFAVYYKDSGNQLDVFKDGNELYIASMYYYLGFYEALGKVK